MAWLPVRTSGFRPLMVLALVATGETFVDAGRQQGARAGCELAIDGTWKPEITVEANPWLLSFSADGWVNVLNAPAEAGVHELDIASQVQVQD